MQSFTDVRKKGKILFKVAAAARSLKTFYSTIENLFHSIRAMASESIERRASLLK
jgi:hypothetical protein